jgi:hypothetical protein
MTYFFMWATLIVTPCIMICKSNKGIPLSAIDPLYSLELTVANLGTHKDFQTYEYCEEEQAICAGTEVVGPMGDKNMSTENAWMVLSFADLAYSLLFIMMVMAWKRKMRFEIQEQSGKTMTVADYTVYVTGLPPDTDSLEVLNHFDGRCNPCEYMMYPLGLGCFGRPKKYEAETGNPQAKEIFACSAKYRKVENSEHNGEDEFLNRWVSDVSFVMGDGEQLQKYLSIQKLLRKIRRTQEIFEYFDSRATSKLSAEQKELIDGLKKTMKVLDARIKQLDRKGLKPGKGPSEVRGAFVTFNQPMSRTIALDIYKTSANSIARMFQPRELRMRRTWPLKVVRACDPEDILWENMGHSYWSLLWRRGMSNMLILIALAISFGFVSYVASLQAAVKASTAGYKDQCAHHLPATFYGGYESIPQEFKLRIVEESDIAGTRRLLDGQARRSAEAVATAAAASASIKVGGLQQLQHRALVEDQLSAADQTELALLIAKAEERPLSVTEQATLDRLEKEARELAWAEQMRGISASNIADDCTAKGGRLYAYDPPPQKEAVYEMAEYIRSQDGECQHGDCENGMCAPILSYCGNHKEGTKPLPGCWGAPGAGAPNLKGCYIDGTCVPIDCEPKPTSQYCPNVDQDEMVAALCDASHVKDETTGELLHEERKCAKIGCLDRLRRDYPEATATVAFAKYGCEEFDESATTGCYCYTRLLELVELDGPLIGAKTLMSEHDGICYTIAEEYLLSTSAQIASGFIIASESTDCL